MLSCAFNMLGEFCFHVCVCALEIWYFGGNLYQPYWDLVLFIVQTVLYAKPGTKAEEGVTCA